MRYSTITSLHVYVQRKCDIVPKSLHVSLHTHTYVSIVHVYTYFTHTSQTTQQQNATRNQHPRERQGQSRTARARTQPVMQTAPNNNGSNRATKPKRNRKPRPSYTDVTEIDGTAHATTTCHLQRTKQQHDKKRDQTSRCKAGNSSMQQQQQQQQQQQH